MTEKVNTNKNFSDLKNKWKKLDYQSCVIEKVIKFDRELSVICSRNIKKYIFLSTI